MGNVNNGLSRRGLIKGLGVLGATGAAAFALQGCANQSTQDATAKDSADEWFDTADVVVIGSGTGMGAVRPVLDAGKKVIVLEKNAEPGGDWAINGGVIYAAAVSSVDRNTVDERTGKADTVDACYNDWMEACNYVPDPDLVRYIVEAAPNLVEYFTERDIEFSCQQTGTHPVNRGHRTPEMLGKPLVDILSKDLMDQGAIFMLDTRADHILLDNFGKAQGVSAFSKEHGFIKIKSPAVIVATGGCVWNNEMVARYNPECYDYTATSGKWATGDGLVMLQELRADFWGWSQIIRKVGGTAGLPGLIGGTVQWYARPVYRLEEGPHPFIYINSDCKRLFNEDLMYVEYPEEAAVPLFAIFDSTEFANPGFTLYGSATHDQIESFVGNGDLFKADTLEDLATQMKLNATALVAAVDKYNNELATGSIEFGRPVDNALPIETAPFYGCPSKPSGRAVPFSIKIDKDGTALTIEGNRIDGVYAAGCELVNESILGPNYPGSGAFIASGFAYSQYVGEKAIEYISAL